MPEVIKTQEQKDKNVGLTSKELEKFNSQIQKIKSNFDKMGIGTMMKGIGAYFGATMIKSFGEVIIKKSN